MIFLVKDKKDVTRDRKIARHVIGIHTREWEKHQQGEGAEENSDTLDLAWLRRYIAFARSRYAHLLDQDLHKYLISDQSIMYQGVRHAYLQRPQRSYRTIMYLCARNYDSR